MEYDHLSSLPDLCLLAILKHLKKIDIYNMRTVCKRMSGITNERCLDKIKWENGLLYIAQTSFGYGFSHFVRCQGYPVDCPTYYYYYVPVNGHTLPDKDNDLETLVNNSNLYAADKCHDDTLRDGMFPDVTSPHDAPIPNSFFHRLKSLLRDHQARVVVLKQIPFEGRTFAELKTLLEDHEVTHLRCHKVVIQQVSDRTRESFAQFARTVAMVDLTQANQRDSNLTNESFLNDITNCKLKRFFGNIGPSTAKGVTTFFPSESILPRIAHLHSLYTASMCLKVEWVTNFLMMVLEAASVHVDQKQAWMFSVDQSMTFAMVSNQIRKPDFKCHLETTYTTQLVHTQILTYVKRNIRTTLYLKTVDGRHFVMMFRE